jgi:hypothetical protein
MKLSRLLVAFCAAFAGLALAPLARAQDCLLTPVPVPGLSGLPTWFSDGAIPVRPELDDPRWGGAPTYTLATDPANSTALRILRQGTRAAVTLQVLADSNGTSFLDSVYFAIQPTTGSTTAHLFRIQPMTSGATDPVPTDFAVQGQYYVLSGGTWTPTTAPPGWIHDIATHRNSPGGGVVWAVSFKFELGMAGVTPAGDFRVFYGIEVHQSGTSVTPYSTPSPTGAVIAGTPVPEAPANWLTTSGLSTACTGGARIDMFGIGTDNPNGEHLIDADGDPPANPATPANPAVNTFHADVFDIPGSIPAGLIRARFSLAQWGSTIADSNAPWTVVPISPGPPATNADNVPNTAATVPAGPANSRRIQFTCTPGAGQSYCPLLTGIDPHQCLLVELRAAPTFNVRFSRAAAYRNLDFEGLSTLDRSAQITIKGLQAKTGVPKDRDVYLYVKTNNLPAPGSEPLWLPTRAMAEARDYARRPPMRVEAKPPREPNDGKPPVGVAANPASAAADPAAARASGFAHPPVLTGYQKISEVWPTYEVHVYYDSGELVERKGEKLKRLVEMVPFGFFLYHDGPLYGFLHSIEGEGFTLETVAPNFYKARIKNEGAISVRTKIEAVERPVHGGVCCKTPPPPVKVEIRPHCYCTVPGGGSSDPSALGLLSLVPVALLLARRRRR